MEVELAVLSDIGPVRKQNEDSLFYSNQTVEAEARGDCYQEHMSAILSKSMVCAVFDGMGGLPHGQTASRTAAQKLEKLVKKDAVSDYQQVFHRLNRAVCRVGERCQCTMGTTAAVLFLYAEHAVAANVGDSRIYHFHDGELLQLSADHTEYAVMAALKKELSWTEEGIKADGGRSNTLTQYLGIPEEEFLLEPEMKEVCQISGGDIFLLCSDGLWGSVSDKRVSEILSSNRTIGEMAEKFKEEAYRAGGKDNITVILLKIGEEESY